MIPSAPIVKIEDLRKMYVIRERVSFLRSRERVVEALKGVSLEIAPGEVFGLLGPNGAGKTTLIKCLTTLLIPTSGSITVNGYDTVRQEGAVQASLGCMLMGERGLYWKLTGRENLEYFGALHYLPRDACQRRARELIERLKLGEIADRAVESYSSGQKMKLAFARALVNDAQLLVLDEPTNTLDVPTARDLRAAVRELNREGRTVIYTTHQMFEAEELCQRVAIIDRGEVIALGTVDELKQKVHQGGAIQVEGVFPAEAVAAVKGLALVREAVLLESGGTHSLRVASQEPRALLAELIHTLYAHGALIEEIQPVHLSLEDVFVLLTGRTLGEDTRVQ